MDIYDVGAIILQFDGFKVYLYLKPFHWTKTTTCQKKQTSVLAIAKRNYNYVRFEVLAVQLYIYTNKLYFDTWESTGYKF